VAEHLLARQSVFAAQPPDIPARGAVEGLVVPHPVAARLSADIAGQPLLHDLLAVEAVAVLAFWPPEGVRAELHRLLGSAVRATHPEDEDRRGLLGQLDPDETGLTWKFVDIRVLDPKDAFSTISSDKGQYPTFAFFSPLPRP
jgi:hypothetical protein